MALPKTFTGIFECQLLFILINIIQLNKIPTNGILYFQGVSLYPNPGLNLMYALDRNRL